MAEQLRGFVSHSHEDNAFCHAIVAALRDAGADVWYDEHNLGSGRLGPTIERELRDRHIFVVILSPDALRSQWVEDETRWAYGLLRRDPKRIIQPITAATFREEDIWLFMQDFKRIEAPNCLPYPMNEAATYLLRALTLPSADELPSAVTRQMSEDVDDLLMRGKALAKQERYDAALLLMERATQLAPGVSEAWTDLGDLLDDLGRFDDALAAYNRAVNISPYDAIIWSGKGMVLYDLGRYGDALDAFDRALALDPIAPDGWGGKAISLRALGRDTEAEVAERRARELDKQG